MSKDDLKRICKTCTFKKNNLGYSWFCKHPKAIPKYNYIKGTKVFQSCGEARTNCVGEWWEPKKRFFEKVHSFRKEAR